MLTDYHLHLRPDEDHSAPRNPSQVPDPFEYWFTAENVDRYREAAAAAGVGELGCAEHIYRFTQALELWKHPFWQRYAEDDLDAYCEFVAAGPIKLGIEADFVPGAEDRTANLLEARPFDYVVGSVHFVGDRAVDMDEFAVWDGGQSADEIWRRYFEMLAEAARSGLFDILAHPDLVKVWGKARPGPSRDPRFYYEPAVEAIAESGVAVEISTAGLRKPVGEIYPAPAFTEMCVEAGACFALSSDAHSPEQVGYEYERALEFMERHGIGELAVFEGRRRRLEPVDSSTAVRQGA